MVEYKYIIKDTGHGSERYGPCEICKKPTRQMFFQKKMKKYTDTDGKTHWLYDSDAYGHKSCLMKKRK